jgi:choline-glycine betaine transporter
MNDKLLDYIMEEFDPVRDSHNAKQHLRDLINIFFMMQTVQNTVIILSVGASVMTSGSQIVPSYVNNFPNQDVFVIVLQPINSTCKQILKRHGELFQNQI